MKHKIILVDCLLRLKVILFSYVNFFVKCIVLSTEAVNKMNDSVEIKVEYVRNEIEIRIESLKNELDKINLNLNNQLTVIRDELYSINKIASGVDIELYEDSLMKLRTMVKKYFDYIWIY